MSKWLFTVNLVMGLDLRWKFSALGPTSLFNHLNIVRGMTPTTDFHVGLKAILRHSVSPLHLP